MKVFSQSKRQVYSTVSRPSIATRLPQLCTLDARLAAALVVALLSAPQWSSAQTALDTYVEAADPSYQYTLEGTIPGPNFTGYQIDLRSQTWRDSTEVTPNVWQHKMTIAQPDTLALNPASHTAILLIDGGSNPGSFDPLDEGSLLAQAALLTNSVVVNLPI